MLIASLVAASTLCAAPREQHPFVSPIFASHMVLQRDKPNTFWGWTNPGSKVSVTIGKLGEDGYADGTGEWRVRIKPPAVGGPYVVKIDGPEHVELDDVMVGDVWVCSGQSNMEMGIGMVRNAQAEIASANNPGIRLFLLQRATSLTPAAVPAGAWTPCTPENVAANGWGGFSAAAYFFGRELNQRLRVPIGLVETCWGGTVAEAWTSRQGLEPFHEFQ